MEPVVKGSEAHPWRAPRVRPHATIARLAGSHDRIVGAAAFAPQRRADALPARIDALDGLRALSILIVLLGHASRGNQAPDWLWPIRDLGILGVYLFFAISGFIITLLMLRERQRSGTVSLSGFWKRRALRILPPFAVACCGIAIAASFGLMQWHWPSFFGALSFTKNFNWLAGDWFFGHFWSLSMEEQFYLFWPLLFLSLMHSRRAVAVLLLLVLASPLLALTGLEVIPPTLANSLPCIPYLAAGCLLAVLLHTRQRLFARLRLRHRLRCAALWIIPLCAVAAACYKRDGHLLALGTALQAVLLPLAAFVLVAETVMEDGLLRGTLSWPPLRWLGLASYSIYLWQQLFLGEPDTYQAHWFWTAWPQNLVAAIVCGALAYVLVERPSGKLKKYLRRKNAVRSRPQKNGPRAEAWGPFTRLDQAAAGGSSLPRNHLRFSIGTNSRSSGPM